MKSFSFQFSVNSVFLLVSSFPRAVFSVQAVTLQDNLQNKCLDPQTVISLAFHVGSFARMCGMCARGRTYAALHEFLRGFKVLVGMLSFHLAWPNLAYSTDQTQIRSHLCTCAFERCLTHSQILETKNLCSAKHL